MTTPPARARRQSKKRVLVVYDDPLHLDLLKQELSGVGYQVESAADAAEALQLGRRRPPHAILSNVVMPSYDGFSLCLAVRDDELLSTVPVVLFSSRDRGESPQVADMVGADAFVERETDNVDAIAGALRRVLGGEPAASAAASSPSSSTFPVSDSTIAESGAMESASATDTSPKALHPSERSGPAPGSPALLRAARSQSKPPASSGRKS